MKGYQNGYDVQQEKKITNILTSLHDLCDSTVVNACLFCMKEPIGHRTSPQANVSEHVEDAGNDH